MRRHFNWMRTHLHCILITGRGYPDVATRCFLKHLSDSFGALPVYALVDCNPDGLQILAQYKVGSARARNSSKMNISGTKSLSNAQLAELYHAAGASCGVAPTAAPSWPCWPAGKPGRWRRTTGPAPQTAPRNLRRLWPVGGRGRPTGAPSTASRGWRTSPAGSMC